MSAEQMTSLMQRRARTAREAQAARAMSLGRALRLTAAKQAEHLMGLALNALGVTRAKIEAGVVRGHLLPDSLILLLDGPDSQVGAAILDQALVTGLIQQQVMGKVSPPAAQAEPRPHTSTDAALCAPFIEALLARAALMPEGAEDRDLLKGYRFGVRAKEPRQAELVLDAPDFELIEMTFDMAAGVSSGKLTLVLPHPMRMTPQPQIEEGDVAPDVPQQGPRLADTVLGLHADLTVALTRLKMPLHKVTALRVGDLVNLDLSSMAQTLIIDGNGRAISRGTLGQIDGMRAVQIEQKTAKHHSQPRRRAADRDALDLPDVTLAYGDRRAQDAAGAPDFMATMTQSDMPSLSDVDVFGNLDDLPDLPDMDEAAYAADAKMAEFASADHEQEDPEGRISQAGW